MTYLKEFQAQINNRDFNKFLQLWEEYCTNDSVDADEFHELLLMIKSSDFAKPFGKYIDTAIPLWQMVEDPKEAYAILKLLTELQTTNSALLLKVTLDALKERHGKDPHFNERLRLVGLRGGEEFQGALSNYDLLAHMSKGKFVFHSGGWGAGEIMEISPLREQVTIEFENLSGRKHFNFNNAFKTLVPLDDDNLLVRSFADPDGLEQEAKKDPVSVIKLLLRDLGPQTAAEIKDALCELVIPEKDWVKWWQAARTKLKKDTMIEVPEHLREPFKLRKAGVSHEARLESALEEAVELNDLLLTSYNFVRDFPSVLKDRKVRELLNEKFLKQLDRSDLTETQELQIRIFLQNYLNHLPHGRNCETFIQELDDVEKVIDEIEVLAFKKRALTYVRSFRKDWVALFLSMLFSSQQSMLREYFLKELNQGEMKEQLTAKLAKLMEHPRENPEMFFWYFQLLCGKSKAELPLSSKEEIFHWFEAFLLLFHYIEFKPEYRDLSKKMYLFLSGKRYATVRQIIEGCSLEFINEFLLLVSKCQTFSDTDLKILRSLAAVVHPSLLKTGSSSDGESSHLIIWTTTEGYLRTQEQIRHIGTTEIVANAKEIEAARALGDLRENSEYKFALEKRSRLQGELKALSEQLHHARIITPADVSEEEIGVGSVVELVDSKDNRVAYTILGPWDADPEKNVLSFQSKFVQAIVGLKKGASTEFRGEKYTVVDLKTIFDL